MTARRCVSGERSSADSGNAILEFVFVAVLCLLPLVYAVVAVATVVDSLAAVDQAARDAGRAFATAASTNEGLTRARVAVRLDLADRGLPDDAELTFVPADEPCAARAVAPVLEGGAKYRVCVSRRTPIPAIPSIAQGRGITARGEFDLYIDDYLVLS